MTNEIGEREVDSLGGPHRAAFLLLSASALVTAFSMPAGRALLAISLCVWIVDLIRSRTFPRLAPVAWLGMAFISVAIIATILGINPAQGLPKLRKLIWLAGIPLSAAVVTSGWRLRAVIAAYAAGTALDAVYVFVRKVLVVVHAAQADPPGSVLQALTNAGSMTDSQRLMVGALAAAGLAVASAKDRSKRRGWMTVLVLDAVALLLHLKRGSIVCATVFGGIFAVLRLRARQVLVLAAIVLAVTLSPPVRHRFADLHSEFDPDAGGRVRMWFRIAPALVAEHPWGIGWRALTNDMMRKIDAKVERNRNHLHSNIAQVLVETGWLGLALYLAWMGRSLLDCLGYWRACARTGREDETVALALVLMLGGLLANGIVEYNFGDAELVLVYGFLMGSAAAAFRRLRVA